MVIPVVTVNPVVQVTPEEQDGILTVSPLAVLPRRSPRRFRRKWLLYRWRRVLLGLKEGPRETSRIAILLSRGNQSFRGILELDLLKATHTR